MALDLSKLNASVAANTAAVTALVAALSVPSTQQADVDAAAAAIDVNTAAVTGATPAP